MTIRTVGTLLALAVVLSGCTTDGKKPTVLPPAPSTSPSPSPSPSAAALPPLPLPPEAAADTAQGASAFASYYLNLLSQAFMTADSRALRAVTAPGCEGCERLIAAVEDLEMQQRKRVGGEYVVKEVAAPPVMNGDVVVDIRYVRSAGRVVDMSGAVIASSAPVPITDAQVRLLRRGASGPSLI